MVLALALVVGVVVLDGALGESRQVSALLSIPPFVAAMFVRPLRTATVGALCVAAMAGLTVNAGLTTEGAQLIRLGGVIVAATMAAALARFRIRQQQQIRNLSAIAATAQQAVLRNLPGLISPARIAVRYVSATAEARVGGDFYEALPVANGARFVVGDVRGKGMEAVRMANVLVGAFRATDHDRVALDDLIRSMDAAFRRMDPNVEDFATVVVLELSESGDLLVANAGHPAPLLIGATGPQPMDPPAPTPPIGLFPDPKVGEWHLDHGDRVFCYTDGLLEARRGTRTFDIRGAAPALASGSAEEAIDHLRATVVDFLGDANTDDMAMLLVERR